MAITAQYILPVISNGFTLEMKTYGAHDTVEGFTLELTDFAAPSVKITARLIKQKTGARLFVNGAEYEVNESVASGAFSFGYNELKKQLRFGDRSYTVQGFDGFSSGKIYVKIVFNGVTGEYPMEIVNMNTQIFTQRSMRSNLRFPYSANTQGSRKKAPLRPYIRRLPAICSIPM